MENGALTLMFPDHEHGLEAGEVLEFENADPIVFDVSEMYTT
jgi:hypothetical protein